MKSLVELLLTLEDDESVKFFPGFDLTTFVVKKGNEKDAHKEIRRHVSHRYAGIGDILTIEVERALRLIREDTSAAPTTASENE